MALGLRALCELGELAKLAEPDEITVPLRSSAIESAADNVLTQLITLNMTDGTVLEAFCRGAWVRPSAPGRGRRCRDHSQRARRGAQSNIQRQCRRSGRQYSDGLPGQIPKRRLAALDIMLRTGCCPAIKSEDDIACKVISNTALAFRRPTSPWPVSMVRGGFVRVTA
jgi:hypothetical protein